MLPNDDQVPDSSGGVRIQTAHAGKGWNGRWCSSPVWLKTIFPVRMKLDREFEISDLARTEPPEGDMPQGSEQARALAYRNEERRLAYVAVTRAQHEFTLRFPARWGRPPRLHPHSWPNWIWPVLRRSMVASRTAPPHQCGNCGDPCVAASNARSCSRSMVMAQPAQSRISCSRNGPRLAKCQGRRRCASEALRTLTTAIPRSGSHSAKSIPMSRVPASTCMAPSCASPRSSTSPHTALGIGVHGALNQLNETWKATGRIPGDDEIHAALERAWPATGFDCLPQEAQLKQRARAMIRRFFAQERERQPQRRPLEIESWLEAEVTPT